MVNKSPILILFEGQTQFILFLTLDIAYLLKTSIIFLAHRELVWDITLLISQEFNFKNDIADVCLSKYLLGLNGTVI
jgi:hypothetical protein